jgi:hypothetical protein
VSDPARTGVLPLRPLTTGELLDAAVVLLRTRTARLLWLGVALAVVEQAILFPLRRLADQDISLLPARGHLTEFGVLIVVGFATEAMIIALIGGVAATEAPRALLGPSAPRRPRLPLGRLLVVGLIAGAVSACGAWAYLVVLTPLQSLGIVAAVFITAIVWPIPYGLIGLTAPAAVIDDRGPGGAVLRSVRLASRNGMRVVWIRILGYVAWLVIRYGLSAATLAIASIALTSPNATVDNLLVAGTAIVVNVLAYPMLGCLDVVLHLEARMRTEGLDILLRGALRRGVAADNALTVPRLGSSRSEERGSRTDQLKEATR